jgi:hypothetical protein
MPSTAPSSDLNSSFCCHEQAHDAPSQGDAAGNSGHHSHWLTHVADKRHGLLAVRCAGDL